jgi:hypothetical protein
VIQEWLVKIGDAFLGGPADPHPCPRPVYVDQRDAPRYAFTEAMYIARTYGGEYVKETWL